MKKTLIAGTIIIVIIIVALLPALYFYNKYKTAQNKLTESASQPKDEVSLLVSEIGKFLDLPKGETPTVATVNDKNKLSSQPFFANAQNGDKVLLFFKWKKAILYDPKSKKIKEIAPLGQSSQPLSKEASSTASAVSPTSAVSLTKPPLSTPTAPTPTPIAYSFVLYNGTNTPKLASNFETELLKIFPSAKVVEKNDARNIYPESLLIKIKNQDAVVQAKIASQLKIKISPLPSGETLPKNGDFLIILGTDKVK